MINHTYVLVIIIIMISSVEPLRVLQRRSEINSEQDMALRDLSNFLVMSNSNGRRLDAAKLAKAKDMYIKITKDMSKPQMKQWLRDNAKPMSAPAVMQDHPQLMENELQHTLRMHKSVLLDKPFVEEQGRNDYLVMNADMDDTFVTVIPNAIYYNTEKKCVNWLDDCSLNGIRDRLLGGVRSL